MDSLVDELEGVRGDVEHSEAAAEAAEARARALEAEAAAAAAEVAALRAEIDVTRTAVVGSAIDASLRRLQRQLRVQARPCPAVCCVAGLMRCRLWPPATSSCGRLSAGNAQGLMSPVAAIADVKHGHDESQRCV